jgi:lipopolysaccharide export system protein LptA
VAAPASAQGPLGTVTNDPTRSLGGRLSPAGGIAAANPTAATPPAGAGAATDPKQAKPPTEITSREAMLDNRINLATFSGEVEVRDPQYNVTCDKLTVYLRKQQKGKPEAKPATEPRPIGADAPDDAAAKAAAGAAKDGADPKAPGAADKSDSGIEKAIAEGNVVIIQDKLDADGKKQRYYGKARKAVFDQDKKTCVLYGWPRISQSLNDNMGKEVIAKQESTVITLDQAGVIKVDGPNTVRLSDISAFEANKPAAQH